MQIFDESRAIAALATTVGRTELGEALHSLTVELYPICRSITGNGVRETLSILQRIIPMEIREVPTGGGAAVVSRMPGQIRMQHR